MFLPAAATGVHDSLLPTPTPTPQVPAPSPPKPRTIRKKPSTHLMLLSQAAAMITKTTAAVKVGTV